MNALSLEVCIKKKLGSFSLDINFQNEFGSLGVLGASGSGKSMLLRCISGIDTPDSGRIAVGKKLLFDSEKKINLKPQQRKIGYLFQSYALFPHMTVTENIACAFFSQRLSKTQKMNIIGEMVALFRLDGLENRFPSQLSGGQQQRVAMARIFASKPDILLLDEPFSALDAFLSEQLQIELLELLRGYKGNIVLVTHNRDEVYRLCDRLLIVEDGKLIEHAPTKLLFKRPITLSAARLTGCKNISRAKKISNTEVFVEDWGINLKISHNSITNFDYIGIRAHDFRPAKSTDNAANLIPVRTIEQLESPFEWNIVFECANPSAQNNANRLWWKCSKDAFSTGLPDYLTVDSDDIMLLHS